MGVRIQSAENLSALDYDCIVFGSDEIWNICNPFSAGDLTFFGAGMGSGPKISYAPSFGSTSLDDPKLASLSPLLAGFEAISVRDENSLAIVESLTGRRPDLVVDPVLLSKPDKPIKNAKTAGAIGTYLMGPSEHDVQRVCQFAAEAAKDLCSIGYHYSWATRNIAFCDPTDVPGLLAGCDLVVTNTFHGVVFSLKNRLPFIIVSHPSKDQKIDTFRRKLGLSTVTSETERIHENHVNQLGSEDQILAGWINESKGFLERHLSA
jgi:polysaccharide pyruvyl transferase WcaK-like protein